MHRTFFFLTLCIVSLALTFWRISLYADPVSLAYYSFRNLASAIGVGAGVSENPYNFLAQNLKEKEEQLAQKERELDSLQTKIGNGGSVIEIVRGDRTLMILLFSNILFFAALIGHLWLDHQQRKRGTFGRLT
ncbi:MAG: hypothetical protein A2934_00305 [Candidatus Sungbacteria bacterium RIFCSPLOWO2_01_FULL_47_10]|uniref:Uncharacterized protein n=1 Tax=Candidatus Sungbacteria bacterium RIFCSPLOWO2_01_FULL_47_10 TaxID=1802276 RepID=A0A1G2LA81_9BACT|nr:MAG: hypothetical protein A2934_00305 [Candidatus Sungbacteria bacterium RIFCSPLOWO2_01_FULL_47_10]